MPTCRPTGNISAVSYTHLDVYKRQVAEGDDIISGCVNGSGLLRVQVTKEFDDSTVAKILELVENASSKKAHVENFITRFARYYTPLVVMGAVLLAVIPPLFFGQSWSEGVRRACTFLVISCPDVYKRQGRVEARSGAVNTNLATGAIEIRANSMRILSESETPPFPIEENSKTKEELRLKYRFLDLRRPDIQKNLMIRSQVATLTRAFLASEGFLEIETPTLIKSTPEGARDYLVPSRVHPGSFYALPQSPQLFKQLLSLIHI